MALTKIKLNTGMVTGSLPDANIPDDITVNTASAVPASGLTGNTLASGVTASSLTSVGTLTGLTVAHNNITLQGTGETQLLVNSASGNNAGIRFQENGSNKWTIGNDQSNDSLFFYDFGASATRFSIDSSGNPTFIGDGVRLFVKSEDQELVSIGRAGSSGDALDQGYIRMKSGGTNKIAFHTAGDSYITGGDLGIGTTDFNNMSASSYAGLKVGGATLQDSGGGNGSATFLSNNAYVGGSNNMYHDGGGACSSIGMTQGDIYFYTFDGGGGSADAQWSPTSRLHISETGASTFSGTLTSGTHLIDGVSNYTGLEVKGSGSSRPQVKFTNVNQGTLGAIYGTEGNAVIIGTGSSNTTALTLASNQKATFASTVNFNNTTTEYGDKAMEMVKNGTTSSNGLAVSFDITLKSPSTLWTSIVVELLITTIGNSHPTASSLYLVEIENHSTGGMSIATPVYIGGTGSQDVSATNPSSNVCQIRINGQGGSTSNVGAICRVVSGVTGISSIA